VNVPVIVGFAREAGAMAFSNTTPSSVIAFRLGVVSRS
jgi:hypothetical protein